MSRTGLVGALAAVVLCATLAVQVRSRDGDADRLRRENNALAGKLDSVNASLDTTRDVARENVAVAAVLGDSVKLYAKRIVQTAQRFDSLDKAFGQERLARYQLSARVDALQATAGASSPTTVSESGARIGEFYVRQAPYTVAAHVTLPAPPDSGTIGLDVALDAIPLTPRLYCSEPNDAGVRSASLTVQAPAWAHVQLDTLQQTPELCASRTQPPRPRRTLVAWQPLIVGIGQVTSSNAATGAAQRSWGAFIGTGLSIGRGVSVLSR